MTFATPTIEIERQEATKPALRPNGWWDARYMALNATASSEAAKALVDDVAQRIHKTLGTEKRARPGSKFRRATAAFLCDLIRAVRRDPERLSYRSMRSNSFTGTGYSFDLIVKIVRGLANLGLIDRFDGNSGSDDHAASAARVRATPSLVDIWASYGIVPADWGAHFTVPVAAPEVAVEPLILRAPTTRRGRYKVEGRKLTIDPSDQVAAGLRDRMTSINEFLVGHSISLGHRSFRRAFALGGSPAYAWNKGGRIASIGEDNYQQAKPAARAAMTIDGEPVVEIDIAACHLTILHGLRGVPFDPETDPYEGVGIPRGIVKDWVVMTLGHTGFHARWPAAKKHKLETEAGGPLAKRYPIKTARQAILSHLPILADWPDIDIGWADLQYVESCVMMATMERLAFDHGTICLPVHDSVIVPAGREPEARRVLEKTFAAYVGIVPRLSVTPRLDSFQFPISVPSASLPLP